MQERVMLILIGGRSAVPSIAGVLQFINEIDRVKFLICNHNRYLDFKQQILKVINTENEDLLFDESDIKIVDPTKFDEVYIAVKELCQDVISLKYVNLTTVPQTMAISVYSYIREKYKQALIFSVNTDQSQIIPLEYGKQIIPFTKKLTVDNYIAMYGLNIFKKELKWQPSLAMAAKYLVETEGISSKILSVIRDEAGGGDSITAPRGFNINKQKLTRLMISEKEVSRFFEKLQEYSIIQKLRNEEKNISFQIREEEKYAFLAGDWLEIFVYDVALKCGFDSVEMEVELNNYRGEIDVFCLNNANALICECKTGKIKSDDLYNFTPKAEKLGGNYCVKLFITSNLEVSEKFINQAENNRIVVISGKDLHSLSEILKKEMQNPTYPRR